MFLFWHRQCRSGTISSSKIWQKKRINRDTSDFATKQRKLYYCNGGGGDGIPVELITWWWCDGGGVVVGVVLELTKVDFLCSIINTHSFSVSEKRWWENNRSELWHPSWQGEDVLHCQAQQEGYRGDQTRPGHPIHRENYQFKNNKWFLFIRCPIIQVTHGSHPVWTDERQKGFSLLWRASNIGVERHTSPKPNPTELSAILDFTSKYCIICTYWEAV